MIPVCSILMNMYDSFYIWSLLTLQLHLQCTKIHPSHMLILVARIYFQIFFIFFLPHCNYLSKYIPNTILYMPNQLPSWIFDTLCPPVVCTLWGPVCVLCCHQHVVVHVCGVPACVFTVHQSMKAHTRSSHASFTATSPLRVVRTGERPAVAGAVDYELCRLCVL